MKRWKIASAILVAYLLIMVLSNLFLGWDKYEVKEIDEGITSTIVRTDGTTTNVDDVFKPLNKGDKLISTIVIPNFEDIDIPALCFSYRNASMRLSFEGEVIKEDGFDLARSGKHIGSKFENVILPKSSLGKEVTLELTATENKAINSLVGVQIMEASNSSQFVIVNNYFSLMLYQATAFVTLLMVFVLGILSLIIKGQNNSLRVGICLGLVLLTLSIYFLASTGTMNLISYDIRLISELEYLTLYLLPVLTSLHLYMLYHKEKFKKVCLVMFIYFLAFFSIATGLNFFTSIHFDNFNLILDFSILVGAVISLVYIRKIKLSKKWEVIISDGTAIFLITVILDIMIYLIGLYSSNSIVNFTVLPIGVIVLLSSVLYGLVVNTIEQAKEHQELVLLNRLAYVDPLTGLANRAKFYEIVDSISDKGILDYIVIFIDLNDLKRVNDVYGHDKGDEYIKRSADLIKEVFHDSNVMCRFGGDEFVVIYDHNDVDTSILIKTYQELLDEINRNLNLKISLSAALGEAISTSSEPISIYDALRLADQNMYQNKKKMKSVK